jgi:choline dehydrogenase
MMWDYIVVGGGLAGSVVSNRLLKQDNGLKIIVIEAGPDANNRTDIVWPNSTNLIGGEFDWNYTSVAQTNLNNRAISLPQGKALGGGTVINSGMSIAPSALGWPLIKPYRGLDPWGQDRLRSVGGDCWR